MSVGREERHVCLAEDFPAQSLLQALGSWNQGVQSFWRIFQGGTPSVNVLTGRWTISTNFKKTSEHLHTNPSIYTKNLIK